MKKIVISTIIALLIVACGNKKKETASPNVSKSYSKVVIDDNSLNYKTHYEIIDSTPNITIGDLYFISRNYYNPINNKPVIENSLAMVSQLISQDIKTVFVNDNPSMSISGSFISYQYGKGYNGTINIKTEGNQNFDVDVKIGMPDTFSLAESIEEIIIDEPLTVKLKKLPSSIDGLNINVYQEISKGVFSSVVSYEVYSLLPNQNEFTLPVYELGKLDPTKASFLEIEAYRLGSKSAENKKLIVINSTILKLEDISIKQPVENQ